MAPLPKTVYELLKKICLAESMTQRQTIIAGILGLHRLKETAPEHLRDVLAEGKKLGQPKSANGTPAP